MKTFIIKNVPLNEAITHDSNAATWGELSQEVEETHGTAVYKPQMKAVLRSNRTTLSSESTFAAETSPVKINLFSQKLDAGRS